MRNRRIFISGGAGVIGTALVNLLLDQGADLFVGDLKPCPKIWSGKVKYRQGDLNTISAEELLEFDPEFFFHLAATFERVEETYPFFDENFHHNICLSHYLMGHLKKAKSLKKTIFASSYLIYDSSLYLFEDKPQTVTALDEKSPIYPRNICGAAKLFHEIELNFLDHFLKEQMNFIAVRIFRVYGKYSRDIISRWVRAALREETLKVYNAEGQFDYIFADDVAEGLLKLADSSFSGIINLGSGQARSIQDVIAILKQHFPALKIQEEQADHLLEASVADMQLFNKATQWMPTHSLETAIPLLIQFERDKLSEPLESPKNQGVLLTSISKKIPLLKAVRAATDKLGHFQRLYGSDKDVKCIGQYGVDVFWHCLSLENLTIETVIAYCQEHQIQAIIPTRDADVEFFAHHLQHLHHQGIQVMVSPLESVKRCLDKKHFADVLFNHGFPAIPTATCIQDLKSQSYVVKERYGSGSTAMALNVSREKAIAYSQSLKHPLFQPYISGEEWSVDLYRSRQGKLMGCVARKRELVVQGESQVTTTASYPALEKLCQEIAHYLRLEGHVVFQVIEDSQGKLHVIECNPRFGGASTASIAVGLDSFYWFFLECLGQNLQEYPFMRKKGEIRQIRHPNDWILPWSSSST